MNDGQPHLRIYANQNHDDIQKGNDFIAPQVIFGTPYWQLDKLEKARVYAQSGAVELSVTVDANGKLASCRLYF